MVGLGVYDSLIQDIVDSETGKVYPALTCCNDKAMADRCKVQNAKPVIWSIKASASFNTEAYLSLRNGFKTNKTNLLKHEFEIEEVFKKTIKNFSKLTPFEQMEYKMPFIQTTLLMYELINLQHESNGKNIKITEKSGMRKDRASSVMYNYWVMLEKERNMLQSRNNGFNLEDFASSLRKLNKAPRKY